MLLVLPSSIHSESREIDITVTPQILKGGRQSVLGVFPDPGGVAALNDVFHHPEWFLIPEKEVPDFDDASVVVWARLSVRNPSKITVERYLEIQWPHFDRINVFVFSPSGKLISTVEAGEELPFIMRPMLSRFFVFPLRLAPGEKQEIILRTRASGGLHLPVFLWSLPELVEKQHLDDITQGIYAGAILVMIVYNVFLLISVRDKSYLFYVLYVFAFFLTQSGFTGIGFQYIWPRSTWIQLHYFPIFAAFTALFLFLFARSFLQSAQHGPFVDGILLGLAGLGFSLLILPFVFSAALANRISNIFIPVASLALTSVAIYIWIRGFRPARFFTLAFLMLAIFIVINQLRSLGLLPVSFFTENGTQIGSLAEVVLLSFALGDRITTLRLEREKIQILAEEQQRKLLMIRDELNVARQIQGAVVQKEFPEIDGLRIAARFQPMNQVGGDFYDFHRTGESSACFVVADVAGHGVPAALLASMAQMSFHLQKPGAESPAKVLDGMNQMLIGRMGDFFLSAGCAHLNARDMELRLASAGHPAMLLVRKGAHGPMQLRPRGRLIGPFSELALEELKVPLQRSDRLLMFSDAILEARNKTGVFFGLRRLRAFAKRNDGLDAEFFAETLLNAVLDWVYPEQIDDDFTLLVIDVRR